MAARAWAVSFSRCVISGAGPTFRRAGAGGSREAAASAASWATCAMVGGVGLATGAQGARGDDVAPAHAVRCACSRLWHGTGSQSSPLIKHVLSCA